MRQIPPRLIRASAGTGKTFELSSRYISLLAMGEKPERILATTFTRKAAFEIEERIFQRLAQAALDGNAAQQLASSIQDSALDSIKASELLIQLVRQQHRLKISTLDSFFFSIAASFSLELGLMPGWQPADPGTEKEVIREALRSLCEHSDLEKIVTLLKLMHGGDVKRSVHERLEEQLQRLFDVYRVSREDAWKCLRVGKGLGAEALETAIKAFETLEIPRTKNGTANKSWEKATETAVFKARHGEWEDFVSAGLARAILDGKEEYYRQQITDMYKSLLRPLIGHAAALLLGRLRAQSEATFELMMHFEKEYEIQRKLRQSLSFSDVKKKLCDAAVTGALDELYYRLDSRIAHLLLDEFQDTSGEEWGVIEPIVDEILSKAALDYSFFCVGDAKQAIYGWRGGVAEVFDTLEKKWPQLQPESKEASYRCSAPVIDVVNRVFSSLATNAALEELPGAAAAWQSHFSLHTPVKKELKGYVRCIFLEEESAEDDDHDQGMVHSETLRIISELRTRAPRAQIGILVRTNKEVASLISALGRVGIPASEEGGTPLNDSKIVCALLSLLRIAEHPGDTVACYHVSASPLGGLLNFTAYDDGQRVVKLSEEIRKNLLRDGYGVLLSKLTVRLLPGCSSRDRLRLSQLVELGFAFERRKSARISDFLDMVKEARVEDVSAEQTRVMTIHQAKGLEFDIVVLPFFDPRLMKGSKDPLLVHHGDPTSGPDMVVRGMKKEYLGLSSQLTQAYQEDRERKCREALSVLYVALTRAKSALFVIGRKNDTCKALNYTALLYDALLPLSSEDQRGVVAELGDLDGSLSVYEASIEEGVRDAGRAAAEPELRIRVEEKPCLLHLSPSELEKKSAVLKNKLVLYSRETKLRGSLLHSFFEMIEWLDKGKEPADATLLSAGRRITADISLIEESIRTFREYMKKAALRAVFEKGVSAKGLSTQVLREHPFLFREGNALYSGSFDRLVLNKKDATVVSAEVYDFKTGFFASAEALQERRQLYFPQILAYKRAVSGLFAIALDSVRASIVWTPLGEVEEVV